MNNTSARDALIEQIKQAENILIALSSDPTIDELTAALGLTLILNKTNDHVTTIFSGEVPSVLNFLEPSKFFDKTVDGLRDFIIALNPEKADRVRTKVVDGMVRVSITPSKAAVTIDDLEFSQGDYNVDLVIALGVQSQADLDKALEAHGRILHSAFVVSIGVGPAVSELGNLNWNEPAVQSYAQIVADLSLNLDPKLNEAGQPVDTVLIDSSVATALMTGLVSVTERFSNNLTTPEIMSLAAVLMGQGANQQLIAKELDEPNKIEALKQSLNQKNQSKLEAAPSDNKLENEAVIEHAPAEATAVETAKQAAESVNLNQIIDKIVENNQAKQSGSEAAPVQAVETAEATAEQEAVAPLPAVEPPVAPAPVEVEQKTDSTEPKPAAAKIDESWDKVNQFKQAFLDKMKQNQETASKARQENLDRMKQQEEPAAPIAEKPAPEVAEPNQSADKYLADDQATTVKKAKKPVLKKKETKVIKPLDKPAPTGPTIDERIAQELSPVPPPSLPPMPNLSDMPLPPPLPPMPPALDQITMTSLPPVEVGFDNNPFDALDKNPAPNPQAPVVNSDAPLSAEETQAIGLPPQPAANQAPQSVPSPAPKAPVPQNQFVIPE